MQKLGLNEIREKYLSFFEGKGHYRMPSFSLVPENDPSLLLINAGMAPLKPFFTGRQKPPKNRVTTCQKCIRTPDIERVGKTARHGTFFEMLGNFSFGDYFKREAINWGWEFATRVMEIPVSRLYVTVYLEDDEAYDIWTKEIGVAPDHVVRMGKEDNFWEIGTGPCGPCSELYYDRGPEKGCGSPDCTVGCECDRFIEFWNLVFTQFDRQEDGTYLKLEHPNIDTGMGLERIACIMQDVDSLFDVDTIYKISEKVCEMAGVTYKQDEKTDISIRVVTDHIRSTVFLVSDGVRPSNEGRGYVLRRLLRRAARHGRLLGLTHAFLADLADTVIEESQGAYPVLAENRDMIKNVIRLEEERFMQTIDAGFQMLNGFIESRKPEEANELFSGEQAFKLYDTYGFPIDLTREILAEKGIEVDEEGFTREMEQQRERARAATRAHVGDAGWDDKVADLLAPLAPTDFVGYDALTAEGKVSLLICDQEAVESMAAGQEGIVVLDKTPFYGEGGGQVGDVGYLTNDLCRVQVLDTKKTADGKYYHIVEVCEGELQMNALVTAQVDGAYRGAVSRNHSVTHLLHKALQHRFGAEVGQAGSLVEKDRMRFDFTLTQPITAEDLKTVELEVNESILNAMAVKWSHMPIDEAKALGATAMFGDKYGDVVRVVTMGDYSMELCGGCHVKNTAEIGLFKILSESGVAAGVRRIEGTTGLGVIHELYQLENQLADAASVLKCASRDVAQRVKQLHENLKAAGSQIEALTAKMANNAAGDLLAGAVEIDGVSVVTGKLENAGVDGLRALGDSIKEQLPCSFVALADVSEGKVTFVTMATKEAVAKGVHAGNIIREIAKIAGGGGGGRPDSAQAGGKDASRTDEALSQAQRLVQESLRK
ncbi:MAG: alanine--tRNA ligase [Ruminococcaceae bacterium]|nr:alanine--tRNA ligase [Oscillospiraceae bacterium]